MHILESISYCCIYNRRLKIIPIGIVVISNVKVKLNNIRQGKDKVKNTKIIWKNILSKTYLDNTDNRLGGHLLLGDCQSN